MELIPHRWRKDLTVAAGGKDEVHKCSESWTHTALHTLYCLTLFVNCVCVQCLEAEEEAEPQGPAGLQHRGWGQYDDMCTLVSTGLSRQQLCNGLLSI